MTLDLKLQLKRHIPCPVDRGYDRSCFTGKERDTESGNDYFEARYYSSAMGRFMSPDWSAKEEPVPYAKLDSPQTLNLYSYVGNNPLGAVDEDGHQQAEETKSEGKPENLKEDTQDLREMNKWEDYKEELARYKEAEAAARIAPRLTPLQEAGGRERLNDPGK